MKKNSTKQFLVIKRLSIFLCLAPTLLFSKPFVTADVKGRLGNQLFVIAAAVSLATDNNAEAKFPNIAQCQKNDVPLNYQKIYWRINVEPPDRPISTIYKEPHYHYAPIPYTPNMKISGFFQSEKYFKHNKEKILKLFAPSEEILTYLKTNYGNLIDNPKAVAVHIRCYHTEAIYLRNGPPLYMKDYFLKVMSRFEKDSLFVIFSDDIKWCKTQFVNCSYRIHFIENEPHYHDFYLLSLFKNIIISNSSFSWWAAYLNDHLDKVVIAPPRWIKKRDGYDDSDVIPEGWIIAD